MPRGTKRKIEKPSSDEKPPKKIKLDLQHDAREENQLPAELVLQLFRLIERAEVVQCSMVCRQWYRIGQREEFKWTFVTNLPLIEDAHEYPFLQKRCKKNTKVTYNQKVEELKLWLSDPLHLGTPVRIETKKDGCCHGFQYLYDHQNNLVAVAKICARNDFDFSDKNNELLWRYTIEQSNEPMKDYSTITGSRAWKVSFFINLKQFDLMAEKNHKTIPNTRVLLQAISEENDQSSVQLAATYCFETFVNRPLKSTSGPQKQPDGFRDDIKLFKYQLNAITWMKSVEDQIGQDAIYTSADRWRGSKTYFDKINKEIVPSRVIRKHVHKEKIRGGILADEVGLGKTFEVLGLILAAPPMTDLEPHPELITSKSTLIMCPEHLCKQWHDEITRATTLSALVVRNYDELKKCTYEDFMTQYDVIVCTYELLSTLQDTLPGSRPVSTSEIKKMTKKLQTNQNLMSEEKCPIIEHFFFHRVIFDEGHLSRNIPLLQHIVGHSKWIVSATPFDSEASKHEISWFFALSKIDGRLKEYRDEMMYRDYVWRNTKASVKDEFIIPEPIDDVVYIELSPIERIMYTDTVFSRQYTYEACCTYTYGNGLMHLAKARIQELGNYAGMSDATRSMLDTLKEEIRILPEQLAQAQTNDERELIEVQQRWGTKVAAILDYLKKLFRERSESRVIVYSRCAYDHLEAVFNKHGVPTASIKGDVFTKVRAIEDFKKEMAPFKVIMMNGENSDGTNMIEATHVILLDPPYYWKKFEIQAIGRAYRQGQQKQITVVLILFKDTVEHEDYIKRDTAKIVPKLRRIDPSAKKAGWQPDSNLKVKEQLSKIAPN